MFEHLNLASGDPLMELLDEYNVDNRFPKVNLGIGLYFDEYGKIPVLRSVQAAAQRLLSRQEPHAYLPMGGLADYCVAIQELLLGPAHAVLSEERVTTIQSVGSSGALRMAANFFKTFLPKSAIWVSAPTWDNHFTLLNAAQIPIHTYPYYDSATKKVDFTGLIRTLNYVPAESIILLQPCCHNPTGLDLSREQWKSLISILHDRNLVPFIDMAYQGFGEGFDEDAWAVRAMADAGLTMVVINSFSKNFALYGERCGGLTFICPTANTAKLIHSQLKAAVGRTYSNPPMHGSKLITEVLTTPDLRELWLKEVSDMRARLKLMRQQLKIRLQLYAPHINHDYLTQQKGMFGYTDLSILEIDNLRIKHAIYLANSGRLCIAGLNPSNIEYVATAMAGIWNKR